ncbi:MAG: DUF1254 domain-containing protein [Solirubrobacterales bacterium]|nr:DUF1254 domain-containing protein [Solirubrobacterales bacterium]
MTDRPANGNRLARLLAAVALAVAALFLAVSPASATQEEYDQAYAIGVDAYKYGLPLVTMDKTYRNQSSINVPNGRGFGPVNRFNPVREFAKPDDKSVVAPNYDTLYNIAWINVARQPMIVHVPKIKNRYFVIPLMDPYTEDFRNLGSVNKTRPGDYAIVGPKDYRTKLPKGVTRIKSKYNRVWSIQRIYAEPGNKKDVAAVNKMQDATTITPLDKYGKKNWKPKPPKKKDRTVNDIAMPTGLDYFNVLGREMKKFPPPAADAAELAKFAPYGIGPGLKPSEAGLSADALAGLTAAVADGPAKVNADLTTLYVKGFNAHNGWLAMETGTYGTDYDFRAVVTQVGLGALLPNEAIYPLTQTDRKLSPLVGSKSYTMHIPKGELPPARAFWSLTLYDSNGFFVQNSIKRYTINNKTKLHYNEDGSLDFYIQSTKPSDPNQVKNWIPSPTDGSRFRLMWRIYDAAPSDIPGIIDGTGWQGPTVTAVP